MFRTAAALALLLAAAGPAAAQERLYPEPPPATHFEGIGKLQQQLEKAEADTFAGLWIAPNQRDVMVAFTRDAAATLARYTRDPKYKPLERPGPTQAELYATQDHLLKALQRLGARPVGAGSDIMKGRVSVEVVGDMTRARAAIASGELVVPPYADIVEPGALKYPEPPPPPPGFVNPVKAFPRINYRYGGIELAILRMGETVLEDGCLRLRGDRRNPVIVWPNEARLDLSHGDVRIFNRMSGETILPGERIILGGSSHELKDEADVIDADPACPGPYVLLTNFKPAAPFEAEMFQRQIEEYAAAHRISLTEARRILEAQGERNRQLRIFGSDLQRSFPEVFGEMVVHGGKATLRLAGDLPVPIPEEFARDITIERVPRSAAELNAVRDTLLAQIEALGLEGVSAGAEVEFGRVTLNVGDHILKVVEAAQASRLTIPEDVMVMTNGAGPAGHFSEHNMDAARAVQESSPHYPAVRALVAATAIPFYGEAPRKPSANGATDIARWLVMLGFTADEITRLRAQGIDPVIDWEAQNGRATLENKAALAEQVVVGEVVSVDPRALLGDGARTTATFRVAEALKGSAAPGDLLKVRLESGFNADGTFAQTNGDPMLLPGLPRALKPGDRYVLFTSAGQYANLARHAGGKPVPGMTMLRQEMSLILPDGRLARTYGDAAPAATLEDLRARVAKVAAKFRAAGVR
ncbi:MAG TPA: hypothetical protein VD906_06345 [Caulobacteraceae bacterium]|nr:hypothetical protein [Caulobacteraceae bacterium]